MDTISVEVINYSPNYLSPTYESSINQACEQQLKKLGFFITTNDSSSYRLLVQVRVDSFNTTGITFFGGTVSQYNRRDVKAITFIYLIRNSSNGTHLYWEAENDIYFFDRDKRDTRRSCSMIKYTLRHIP